MSPVVTVLDVNAARDNVSTHESDQFCTWLRNLGVDYRHVKAAVILERDGVYELHLCEDVPHPVTGVRRWIDHAVTECVTSPRVIPLGTERTWPAIHPVARNAEAG